MICQVWFGRGYRREKAAPSADGLCSGFAIALLVVPSCAALRSSGIVRSPLFEAASLQDSQGSMCAHVISEIPMASAMSTSAPRTQSAMRWAQRRGRLLMGDLYTD